MDTWVELVWMQALQERCYVGAMANEGDALAKQLPANGRHCDTSAANDKTHWPRITDQSVILPA